MLFELFMSRTGDFFYLFSFFKIGCLNFTFLWFKLSSVKKKISKVDGLQYVLIISMKKKDKK